MKRFVTTCDHCGWSSRPADTAKRANYALRIHSCEKKLNRDASRARRLARTASIDRTPKPCNHKRANHTHGTHACYVLDRCRCDACREANTSYERTRSRLHAYGRFDTYVPADPVRQHVRRLTDAGIGLKRVHELSGVSQSALGKLMYGTATTDPTSRVTREVAERIMATRITIDSYAAGARIPNVGTKRRLQALIAIGWSQRQLANHIGMQLRNFAYTLHGERAVTAGRARKIAAIYDQLWDTPAPTTNQWEKSSVTRTLNYARRHGFVPPLAWDDDTIDDPTATPTVEQRDRPGGKQVYLEDIEFLLDLNPMATAQQLAQRLNVTRDAIQACCRRAGRTDLLEQLARNAELRGAA